MCEVHLERVGDVEVVGYVKQILRPDRQKSILDGAHKVVASSQQ